MVAEFSLGMWKFENLETIFDKKRLSPNIFSPLYFVIKKIGTVNLGLIFVVREVF